MKLSRNIATAGLTVAIIAMTGGCMAELDETLGDSAQAITGDPLTYGTTYHIQNGYAGWQGGYLDTRESGCEGNYLCVSTSHSSNRANNSGLWRLVSASDAEAGDPVKCNDEIYLVNQWAGGGGYLETHGTGCEGNAFCVTTAAGVNLQNSARWRVIPQTCSDGLVSEEQTVHLHNGYDNWRGGFLDTSGSGCEQNYLCVSASTPWNRISAPVTSNDWRFVRP